jgi:hypothetical protein
VSFTNLVDFDFTFFKIIFIPRDESSIKREKIHIQELRFTEKKLVTLFSLDSG